MEPILKGVAASAGVAEGLVRIIESSKQADTFQENDILVAKQTEPSMVIMMNKAAGFVTDYGGMTGHAAIVARELGVPCVAGTGNATTILKDGMRIRIDGTKGEVYVL